MLQAEWGKEQLSGPVLQATAEATTSTEATAEATAEAVAEAEWDAWFDRMLEWRHACRAAIRYDGSVYEEPTLRWTQTSYMQPQMHLFDRFFYNETTREYTPLRWLQDLKARFGGIDAALLWPTYP